MGNLIAGLGELYIVRAPRILHLRMTHHPTWLAHLKRPIKIFNTWSRRRIFKAAELTELKSE